MASSSSSGRCASRRNARDKDLAWSFIRDDVEQGRHARRGAQRQRAGARLDLRRSRASPPPSRWPRSRPRRSRARACRCPAFPEAARAQAMFLEEVQLAVLGRKTPAKRWRTPRRACARCCLPASLLPGRLPGPLPEHPLPLPGIPASSASRACALAGSSPKRCATSGRVAQQVRAQADQRQILRLGLQHHVEVEPLRDPHEGDELERIAEIRVARVHRRDQHGLQSCASPSPCA